MNTEDFLLHFSGIKSSTVDSHFDPEDQLQEYTKLVVLDSDIASQHATALSDLAPEAFDNPTNPNRLTSIEREALVTEGVGSQSTALLIRFLQCPSDMVTVSDRVGLELPDAWIDDVLALAKALGSQPPPHATSNQDNLPTSFKESDAVDARPNAYLMGCSDGDDSRPSASAEVSSEQVITCGITIERVSAGGFQFYVNGPKPLAATQLRVDGVAYEVVLVDVNRHEIPDLPPAVYRKLRGGSELSVEWC